MRVPTEKTPVLANLPTTTPGSLSKMMSPGVALDVALNSKSSPAAVPPMSTCPPARPNRSA